jgi:hypothetical protein
MKHFRFTKLTIAAAIATRACHFVAFAQTCGFDLRRRWRAIRFCHPQRWHGRRGGFDDHN